MKISVITPTYNRAHTIRRAIESLLNQTYENWEMIIVDDGSTDSTYDVIKPYLSKDRRIKYITLKENKGVNRARNIGMKNISEDSSFITFLDSDDIFLKEALKKMKNIIERFPGYKIYSFATRKVNGESMSFLAKDILEVNYKDLLGITGRVKGEWVHCISSDLVRRNIFKYEEKIKNGYESIAYLRLVKQFPFLHVKTFVREYNTDTESLTRLKKLTYDKALDIIKGLNIFLKENEFYLKENKKLYALHLSVLGKAYFYAGKKRKFLITTLKAFRYNPFELRVYRNLFLLFGVKF